MGELSKYLFDPKDISAEMRQYFEETETECGAPWERVTTKALVLQQDVSVERGVRGALEQKPMDASNHWDGVPRGSNSISTIAWRPTCSCNLDGIAFEPDDLEIIDTPTGERAGDDPSLVTGRAGYNRPRGDNEGQRPITRYEQRRYAIQLRESPYREQMETQAGNAFAHYIRIDKSGARPIPPDLLDDWIGKGWLIEIQVPEFRPFTPIPCRVLDPFAGTATVGEVALEHGRAFTGIELSGEYIQMAIDRLSGVQLGFGI